MSSPFPFSPRTSRNSAAASPLLALLALVLVPASASAQETPSLVVTTTADTVNPADNQTSLREALTYANTLGTRADITFDIPGGGTIALAAQNAAGARMLPILTNPHGITIDGANGDQGQIVIDGGSTSDTTGDRVFFIGVSDAEAATATGFGSLVTTKNTQWEIKNLTIQNGNARGGDGGNGSCPGGGGAGLGGGVFVNAGSLSLASVDFLSNRAVGGNSGINGANNNSGGGGLGGNGGVGGSSGRSGGGGFGVGANGGSNLSTGQSGLFTGAAAGGAGNGDGAGGNDGGGAGSGSNGGGGGVGGSAGTGAGGGAGGFGGGGGGGFIVPAGAGGFGGGGGGTDDAGGNGGFGGGGGAGGVNGGSPGTGGFGAGNGGNFSGGGGSGAGGAVFVRQGASVTFSDGGLSVGSVTGGTGATNGQAIGSGIFLAGGATWEITDGNSVILDDSLGGGVDAQITGGFTKTGPGLLVLNGTHTYTGGTTVNDGTLDVSGTISDPAGTTTITGTATLGGSGTLAGPVSITGTGQIYPATGSIGTLRTGPLTFASGTKLLVDLSSSGTHDQVEVTGNATLGGATLDVRTPSTIAAGLSFPVLTSTGTVSGTFAGLPNNATFTVGGTLLRIAYTANAVTLNSTLPDLNRAQADAPFDLFTATGQAPGNGAFSGTGVTDNTFTPGGSVGVQTITFTPTTGSPVVFTITVTETASLVVTTTADTVDPTDGQTSLREALAHAATLTGPQIITFSDSAVNGAVNFHDGTAHTITLGGTQLAITSDVTLTGPGADRLALDGDEKSRVFHVATGTTVTMTRLIITGGRINDDGRFNRGGGIFNAGTLTLTECFVTGNAANDPEEANFGGGIYNSGVLRISRCTLAGNSAIGTTAGWGGAIYNHGDLSVTGSTFSGNTVSGGNNIGGAIFQQSGTLSVLHSTLTGNSAASEAGSNGGAIRISDGTVEIGHSIIAGNSAMAGPDIQGTVVSLGHNLIGKTNASTGWIASDFTGTIAAPLEPLLGPLAGNGGPTPTHALLPGSPAIDAGDPAFDPDALTPSLTNDQRGQSRVRKGLVATASARVDIGAYEAAPQRLHVNKTVTGGDGSGDSWANAMPELRTATARAQTDPNVSEIWVAAGTYTPAPADGDRAATFRLRSGLAIYGGFNGTETELSQRNPNPATNGTILSGDLNGNDGANFANYGDNSYQVVVGSGTDATARLDGFAVRGGNANGAFPRNRGGGIYNDGGSPTLTNISISGNSADNGGGIFNISSSPTLTNITISGNSARNQGGGIYNDSSSPTLTNVTLSGNSASINGGGIYNIGGSSPMLTNVTLSGNSASFYGGGIYNANSSNPVLTNVTLSGNSAGSDGGGIFNANSSSPMLTNVTLSGNSADSGGGIYNFSSSPIIRNSILWGNTASSGSQISNVSSTATVSHSIVQGGWVGTGNLNADPLFIAPAVATSVSSTTAGNFRLQPGSPAINAGDNSVVTATTDLDGAPRIAPVGGTVDMGAYELIAPPVLTNTALTLTLGDTLPDLATATGADPAGGVFTGAGVSLVDGKYVFDPGSAALGTQFTLTYTITGPGGSSNLATFTVTVIEAPSLIVTTTSDTVDATDGQTSLREALARASTLTGPQTITFSDTTANGAVDFHDGTARTITLGGTQLEITSDVTIDGPGAERLAVSGNEQSRVFEVNGGAHVTLQGLTLRDGRVVSAPFCGGGVFNAGELHIVDCVARGNFVGNGIGANYGGGIHNSGSLSVTGSAIHGNAIGSDYGNYGGGLSNVGTMNVNNSTISGNSLANGVADQGGGIYNVGSLILTHSTVTGNTLAGSFRNGAGAHNLGSAQIHNSIVAGNMGSETSPDFDGAATSLGHNLIGKTDGSGGWIASDLTGTAAAPLDPRLAPLADNGGPTLTHALLPGSPAIDAGDPDFDPASYDPALTTDQRGQARVVRGLAGSAPPRIDIGAYELFAAPEFTSARLQLPAHGRALDLFAAAGASPGGGIFSGAGVDGAAGTFRPAGLAPGIYELVYTVTDAWGASNFAVVEVQVLPSGRLVARGPRSFRPVEAGRSSRPQTLRLVNVGGWQVGGIGLRLSGAAARDFRAARPSARVLEPGASATVRTLFRPRRAGMRRATLLVRSGGPVLRVVLRGRGVTRASVAMRPPRGPVSVSR